MKRTLTALVLAALVPSTAEAALVRGDLGPARGNAKSVAAKALAQHAKRLRIDASAFRFTDVDRSNVGTHVRGFQFADGVRVEGSAAIVSIVKRRVVWVEAQQVRSVGSTSSTAVGARSANIAALQKLSVSVPTKVTSERLLTDAGDVYRVRVFALRPGVAATVDVAAASGRVLAVRDENRYDDAVGTVFDPNPIVTSRNSALRQPGVDEGGVDTDLDSAELTAQLKDRPVLGYDPQQALAGRLVGPWASVQGAQPYVQVNTGRFEYTRGMPGFEGLMSYVHVDAFQRYVRGTLGMTSVNAEPQDIYAVPIQGFDNSFYQPANDIMVMGAGGVDDGEDAEVTLHEYGHAVQDAQVPGWGATAEGGAMGEGFGDFQAGAYFARTSGGFQDTCLMDWDSTSYSSTNPACIRRMDTGKRYPKDVENQVHADGEIWTDFLWRVRARLGTTEIERSDNALKLVLTSHPLLTPQANFRTAVLALQTAAGALGHPEWVTVVNEEATTTGFPIK